MLDITGGRLEKIA